jgi:hypothetical protein
MLYVMYTAMFLRYGTAPQINIRAKAEMSAEPDFESEIGPRRTIFEFLFSPEFARSKKWTDMARRSPISILSIFLVLFSISW